MEFLLNHPMKDTRMFNNIYYIIEIICENGTLPGMNERCQQILGLPTSRIFNISLYFDNSVQYITVVYIYPPILILVTIGNVILLVVLIKTMERNSFVVLIACLSITEILACSFYNIVLIMYHADHNNNYDFYPANLAYFILISNEIIPDICHTVSIYIVLGILVQRFLVVSRPLTFKAKFDNVQRAFAYCAIVTLFAGACAIPRVLIISGYKKVNVASKINNAVTIETLLVNYVEANVTYYKIIDLYLKAILLRAFPVLVCTVLEIKFYRLIRRRNTQQNNLRVNTNIETLNYLSRITLFLVAVFLTAEIPNGIIQLLICYYGTFQSDLVTTKTIFYISNLLTTLCYLATTICLFTGKKYRRAIFGLFCRITEKTERTKSNNKNTSSHITVPSNR